MLADQRRADTLPHPAPKGRNTGRDARGFHVSRRDPITERKRSLENRRAALLRKAHPRQSQWKASSAGRSAWNPVFLRLLSCRSSLGSKEGKTLRKALSFLPSLQAQPQATAPYRRSRTWPSATFRERRRRRRPGNRGRPRLSQVPARGSTSGPSLPSNYLGAQERGRGQGPPTPARKRALYACARSSSSFRSTHPGGGCGLPVCAVALPHERLFFFFCLCLSVSCGHQNKAHVHGDVEIGERRWWKGGAVRPRRIGARIFSGTATGRC